MSLRTYSPTSEVYEFYDQGAPVPYHAVVGAAPQWGDASLDSYADAVNGGDEPSARLPVVDLTGFVELYIEALVENLEGGPLDEWEAHVHYDVDTFDIFYELHGEPGDAAGPQWLRTEASTLMPFVMQEAFEGGTAYISLPFTDNPVRVYEMRLVVNGGTTRQRLNQRDDYCGRRGTSRQNSNRLTGYR